MEAAGSSFIPQVVLGKEARHRRDNKHIGMEISRKELSCASESMDLID